MIGVSIRQTERATFARGCDPCMRAESFTALVAHRVAVRDEYLQVELIAVRSWLPSEAAGTARLTALRCRAIRVQGMISTA
jgi:hypothetical protein